MKHSDLLHRFVIDHTNVRGEIVHLDSSWQAVLERHPYPPAVRDVLGEAMAAAALLSATIKYNGSLILQIQGDGPLTLLVVNVTSARNLRGVAEWNAEVSAAPLKEQFSNGRLAITVDSGDGKEQYQGIVDLGEGGLAAALEGYFQNSEQLDTRLWLAADGRYAAGLLLQAMPDDIDSPYDCVPESDVEDHDAWNRLTRLGTTLTEAELLDLSQQEVLHRLFHQEPVRIFEPEPVSFRCTCSRERIEDALRTLGAQYVDDILSEQGKVHVDCSFCNQRYEFDPIDVERIFSDDPVPEIPKTRH